MVKMFKNDIFFLLFSILKKVRLSSFCIKLHTYIHCHIYALLNETAKMNTVSPKGSHEG